LREKGGEKLKHKIVVGLLVTALFLTTLVTIFEIKPVHAPGGSVWIIPVHFPTLQAAIASPLVLPNDEIHILAGHVEMLTGPMTIWQSGLWIIGSPPLLGPMPQIDVAGFVITISGSDVFMWGLNIIDSTGMSPALINLAPPSANCLIMNNTITGMSPGNTGILIQGANNIVTLNTISTCGICINIANPGTNNIIKLNTINLPNYWGIMVGTMMGPPPAGPNNAMYWNNVWTLIPPQEFWDATPGSPPNWFDDTSAPGGPAFMKGNYWGTAPPPPPAPPFPIPGPGMNNWWDFFPQPAPIAQLNGDLDVNGVVNIFDIVLVAIHFGQVWCTRGWDPRADIYGDGQINIFDIVVIALNFGAHY
jgi:hypothetical protein